MFAPVPPVRATFCCTHSPWAGRLPPPTSRHALYHHPARFVFFFHSPPRSLHTSTPALPSEQWICPAPFFFVFSPSRRHDLTALCHLTNRLLPPLCDALQCRCADVLHPSRAPGWLLTCAADPCAGYPPACPACMCSISWRVTSLQRQSCDAPCGFAPNEHARPSARCDVKHSPLFLPQCHCAPVCPPPGLPRQHVASSCQPRPCYRCHTHSWLIVCR